MASSSLLLSSLLLLLLLLTPQISDSRSLPSTTTHHQQTTHPKKPITTLPSSLSSPPSTNCSGRWIHILPLPARFNSDLLLNCNPSSFPIFSSSSFCPSFLNRGLGPRTHNRSRSWFRTDSSLSLEPLFHSRLLEYPCLSSDPLSADAVFLPYYSSLDALPFLYSPSHFNLSNQHGLALHRYVQANHRRVWQRRAGHDFFLVSGRPAWDLNQDPAADPPLWGTSFLQIPEFLNVTLLTVESRAWPWQDQAIPYPTSFHPATLARLEAWISRARRSRRTNLALFVGGGGSGGPNIRASIRSECENRTDLCELVDCSGGVCSHDPIRFMRPMLRSDFCLQPPGDTLTRRSTFDGILAGCIPVFFEEISAKLQYGWHLPRKEYDQFSVFIQKEEVVFNGVKIMEVLERIPKAEVRRMRAKVLELVPRVMYRRHGSSGGLRQMKDAVDIAIDGVLRRIKRRVRALAEPDLMYQDDDEEKDGGGEK